MPALRNIRYCLILYIYTLFTSNACDLLRKNKVYVIMHSKVARSTRKSNILRCDSFFRITLFILISIAYQIADYRFSPYANHIAKTYL